MVVSFRPTRHGWLVEKTQPWRTAEKRKPKEFNLFKQLDKVGLTLFLFRQENQQWRTVFEG